MYSMGHDVYGLWIQVFFKTQVYAGSDYIKHPLTQLVQMECSFPLILSSKDSSFAIVGVACQARCDPSVQTASELGLFAALFSTNWKNP